MARKKVEKTPLSPKEAASKEFAMTSCVHSGDPSARKRRILIQVSGSPAKTAIPVVQVSGSVWSCRTKPTTW